MEEEEMAMRCVTIQGQGRFDKKRVGSGTPEEIEARIDLALQGKRYRILYIDTVPISFVSLYKSFLHVRGTLEQLRLNICEEVPWSFLCKVVAACPRLRKLQLACGMLVGEFPSDVVLHNLVDLSLMPLTSKRSRCLRIVSPEAITTLLNSVRSLKKLTIGSFGFGRKHTRACSTQFTVEMASESLCYLHLERWDLIDVQLQTPNLEVLHMHGGGNKELPPTLGKLAWLETRSMPELYYPPPTLKALVIGHCHETLSHDLLHNIEILVCDYKNIVEVLNTASCPSLRILGIAYYTPTIDNSREIIDRLKSFRTLEKVYIQCPSCYSLKKLNFQSENSATRERPCPSCEKVYAGYSGYAGEQPDSNSATGDLFLSQDNIDLSKISEVDWDCNLYKVDISSVKKKMSLIAPFYFTGSLPQELSTATIMYVRTDLPPELLVLPAEDEAVHKLLQNCTDAVFGQDDKDVYDPTYRKALKLNPENFVTTFHPWNCGIIDELSKGFSTELHADLYKLNVYRPGDFFRVHRDTPRDGLIGSLVVVLPGNHTGGELLVRHRDVEHCLSIQDGSKVHWAAFYSDCEHEVKELTSGFRLTLTYNLFRKQRSRPSPELFDARNLPIYQEFMSFKKMRGKRKVLLGVACRYSYPFNRGEKERISEEMVSMLKGEDAMVFAAATAAGLKPVVVQLWNNGEMEHQVFMTPTITSEFISSNDQDSKLSKAMPLFDAINKRNIVWVNREDLDYQVGGGVIRYGNEAWISTVYRALAILMYVNVQEGDQDDVLKVRMRKKEEVQDEEENEYEYETDDDEEEEEEEE